MGRPKTTEYWTPDRLMQEIRRIMGVLGVDYMPKTSDIKEHSSCLYAIHKTGGMKKYAEMMGIPLAPSSRPGSYTTKRKAEWDDIEKWEGRPSMAFEIEAKARKQGLSYADLQKAETLRLAGRISI